MIHVIFRMMTEKAQTATEQQKKIQAVVQRRIVAHKATHLRRIGR